MMRGWVSIYEGVSVLMGVSGRERCKTVGGRTTFFIRRSGLSAEPVFCRWGLKVGLLINHDSACLL